MSVRFGELSAHRMNQILARGNISGDDGCHHKEKRTGFHFQSRLFIQFNFPTKQTHDSSLAKEGIRSHIASERMTDINTSTVLRITQVPYIQS